MSDEEVATIQREWAIKDAKDVLAEAIKNEDIQIQELVKELMYLAQKKADREMVGKDEV